jgi:hypothetical protein
VDTKREELEREKTSNFQKSLILAELPSRAQHSLFNATIIIHCALLFREEASAFFRGVGGRMGGIESQKLSFTEKRGNSLFSFFRRGRAGGQGGETKTKTKTDFRIKSSFSSSTTNSSLIK